MRRASGLALCLAFIGLPLQAAPLEELQLLAEHPIEGVPAGNLSGLAWCAGELLSLSDRDDDRLYRLQPGAPGEPWQAEAQPFVLPAVAPAKLPWGLRARAAAAGLVRGGAEDFEGLSCDHRGNRYLVSEARAAVLRVATNGEARWVRLPDAALRQARASGMLLHFNALYEGIAVDPAGERLWLAAERERRGLLVLHGRGDEWHCRGGCVLMSDSGRLDPQDPASPQLDFAGLAFHDERLFTLERSARRICRRALGDGAIERCWSFADVANAAPRDYPSQPWGAAEGLWIDADGAWLVLDNNGHARGDGDDRPILWHMAAPADGWSASA